MSTNLKVFHDNIQKGFSPKESALLTPAGKWAQKFGFNEVRIISQSMDEVNVSFHKQT